MGSSNRRKRRREAEKAQQPSSVEIPHENAAPVLRLVRPEILDVPSKPDASGQSDPPVNRVREPQPSHGVSKEETRGNPLEPGLNTGSDDLHSYSGKLVARSFDVYAINGIFNDPSVFPFVSIPGLESIDVSAIISDPRNVFIMGEGGGVLFCFLYPGTYEVHTGFLEHARGRNALRTSLAAYHWMFTHTDGMTLLTRVPATNRAAENFCKLVGAKLEFERQKVWPTEDGPVDMTFWSLRYDDWVRGSPSLRKAGRAFHDRLLQEKARLGHVEPQHVDEDCHNIHVGACMEMIYGGQLEKAIILYNKWAHFAGYGLIELRSGSPVLIDIGEALLQVTGDTFKVVLCR